MASIEGVRDWSLLNDCFGIRNKYHYGTAEAYHNAIVEQFLLGQGFYQPTWRAVIYCLDRVGEVAVADKIRNFGEPVQGECTCHCSESCGSRVMVHDTEGLSDL